jgi:hypothetical protein
LRAFAGKSSQADLAFKLATQINITVALSLSLAGATTFLWRKECREHRKTRDRLTKGKSDLELKFDPNRESSRLTNEGTTREEDQ